jgi:hypothetical protein
VNWPGGTRGERARALSLQPFRVGRRVRTVDGRVFTGCNVENASFGLTICAERNAIFQASRPARATSWPVAVLTRRPSGRCRRAARAGRSSRSSAGRRDVSVPMATATKRWTAAECCRTASG